MSHPSAVRIPAFTPDHPAIVHRQELTEVFERVIRLRLDRPSSSGLPGIIGSPLPGGGLTGNR
jgi:hypothetical protein